MELFNKNLEVIKKNHPALYKEINSFSQNTDLIETVDCKTGTKTARVTYSEAGSVKRLLLHSQYDPVAEALRFSKEKTAQQQRVNIIYGFGFGYHVQAVSSLLSEENELFVLDRNLGVFIEAMKHRDLTDVLSKPNVRFFISADIRYLFTKLGEIIPPGMKEKVNIITHAPSIHSIDDRFSELKFFLLELDQRKSITDEYLLLLEENYQSNTQHIKHNVGVFFNRFKNIPVIIVCAGPSLDKNKHLLREVGNRGLIICVGKALKALINMKVIPDFLITIDPGQETAKQIEGCEHLDIPFILLATAAGVNARRYKGPKFLACQYKDYLKTGQEEFLVKTGGSVSTTALDIAIRMGGNPIAYIGQDLAYSDNRHHCVDAPHKKVEVNYVKNMRMVKGWKGEDLPSSMGFISFIKWIQNRILTESTIDFVNATEGGAYIGGMKHMPFGDFINKYLDKEHNHKEIIREVTGNKNR